MAALTGTVSERDQEIVRLKDLSDKSQGRTDELNRADHQIALLNEKVSERDQEIVRLKSLMDQNHSNATDLDRLKQQMAGLSDAVSERDQEIARLKGILEQQKVTTAEKDLLKLLQPEISKGNVSVHQVGEQLKINLTSGLLFDSGKAQLKPAGIDVIKRVGGVLKEFPERQISVGGYTDNIPIRGVLQKTFPNNMELSKARAEHAATALEYGGVSKAKVTFAGHADTDPVADNKTEVGRKQNRRVEIVVQ